MVNVKWVKDIPPGSLPRPQGMFLGSLITFSHVPYTWLYHLSYWTMTDCLSVCFPLFLKKKTHHQLFTKWIDRHNCTHFGDTVWHFDICMHYKVSNRVKRPFSLHIYISLWQKYSQSYLCFFLVAFLLFMLKKILCELDGWEDFQGTKELPVGKPSSFFHRRALPLEPIANESCIPFAWLTLHTVGKQINNRVSLHMVPSLKAKVFRTGISTRVAGRPVVHIAVDICGEV